MMIAGILNIGRTWLSKPRVIASPAGRSHLVRKGSERARALFANGCFKSVRTPLIVLVVCSLTTASFAAGVDYRLWARVLETYVDDNGRVDYAGLKAHRQLLDDFIEQQLEPVEISALADTEQKAFWINAYNALTLRLIVDHYPLRFGGIRTINWGRPWSIKMRVANQSLTLGQIEHEILRKWDPPDPRIHFAINCASGGCPKLPKTPFLPETLEEQLQRETLRFINDPEKVRLDRSKNILYHSAIFSWFDEDFLAESPDLLQYIQKYLNEEDQAYIQARPADIRLKKLKYDWSLNQVGE